MDLIQIQLALFFKTNFKRDFELLSLGIKDVFGKSLHTQLLPIGDEAPPDLPRLILSYQEFNINVSLSRLDVFFKNPTIYLDVLERLLKNVLKRNDIKIGRIGFIKTFFNPQDPSSLKSILDEKYQVKNFKEINLRFNEPLDYNSVPCNNIEKIDPGVAQKKVDNSVVNVQGVFVQRDINTVPESPIEFSDTMIQDFVRAFSSIADSRLIN